MDKPLDRGTYDAIALADSDGSVCRYYQSFGETVLMEEAGCVEC